MRVLSVPGIIFVLACLPGAGVPARAADLPALARAAEAGDADAALALGTAYDTGRGVAADPSAALHWYEIAAERGNAEAMFDVGVMYDSGTGVARDRAEAARWYEQAARAGHARAAYNLGLLYQQGDGVRRNLATAARWFRAASHGGLAAGTSKLAALEPSPTRPAEDPDYLRAEALIQQRGLAAAGPDMLPPLRRAAERGIKVAQYDLAFLYENGLGVGTDWVEAYIWYSRAALPAVGLDPTIRNAAIEGVARVGAKLDATQQLAAAAALRSAAR